MAVMPGQDGLQFEHLNPLDCRTHPRDPNSVGVDGDPNCFQKGAPLENPGQPLCLVVLFRRSERELKRDPPPALLPQEPPTSGPPLPLNTYSLSLRFLSSFFRSRIPEIAAVYREIFYYPSSLLSKALRLSFIPHHLCTPCPTTFMVACGLPVNAWHYPRSGI